MKLEICANSYQSAKNAQDAGAHRIELCQELAVGGITPSYGLLRQVLENLEIPVFVLIRPRGGDFVYSDAEFEIMKHNIQMSKNLGCQGIVSGVLNIDKTLDLKRTKELLELAKPLPFTFHRAFDEVVNPNKTLEQLIYLGVERLLTSGQKATANEGLDNLIELNKQAKGRIILLVGSGISAENALKFKVAGFKEIHASASSLIEENTSLFSMPISYADPIKIKSILDAI